MEKETTMSEVKPTMNNLSDPYVLQLIEALSSLEDEIEDLTQERNEMQLVAGRYQYQFEHAMKCINSIDDLFEYAYTNYTRPELKEEIREYLKKFSDAVAAVPKGE